MTLLPYKLKPREYQRQAMGFIFKMKRVLLALEMGLGKTKIVLDFIERMTMAKKIGRSLVILPLSIIPVWESEIAKNWHNNNGLTYRILRPGSNDLWKSAHLVLTNYDYARTLTKELMEWGPDLVVFDESHKIKNPYAKQSKMAHRFGAICRYAVCMTGTPIGNHPLDLWSQFKFLVPDLLDEKFKDFKNKYVVWGGPGGYEIRKYKHMDLLASFIRPHVRSLKKKDYLMLPDKNFIEIPVEMGEKARRLYDKMEKEFVVEVRNAVRITAPIVLAKLTKLSQISGGFIRNTETEKSYKVHTAKLEVLEGITENLRENDVKRVVIFARFLWEISHIKTLLAPNWTVLEISGRASESDRKLAQEMFASSDGSMVMICQIASGSVGLNLQSANYCIFYSLDYSFINFAQAQDRIHRSGQTKKCFYYMLLAKATLDRRIYSVLREKRNISDAILDLVKEASNKERA